MVRRLLAKGTLSFGTLLTIFLLVVFTIISSFTQAFFLILVAPILAGFIIGTYAKGKTVTRGKRAFLGVLAGTLITMVLSSLSLFMLTSPLAYMLAKFPLIVIALILSPVICGVLGLVGGLISGAVAKRARRPSELPTPPPPAIVSNRHSNVSRKTL